MKARLIALLLCFVIQSCTQVDKAWNSLTRPSLESTRERAETGSAVAQYELGQRYLAGDGIAADASTGFNWLQRAAEQGHSPAQFSLGQSYELGLGVARDDELAASWYRRAAVSEPRARERLSSLIAQKRVKSQPGDPLPSYAGPGCAENGSCYGDTSTVNGMPKTIHVPGYYRKDGTYVRGHYRSRGRR